MKDKASLTKKKHIKKVDLQIQKKNFLQMEAL
jgi:hypothetical protein